MEKQQRVIAITGATGFIGRNLVKELHAAGNKIKILVRSKTSIPELNQVGIEHVSGSLDIPESLHKLVQNSDAIIHCAGAVRGVTRKQFNRVNVEGTGRLVTIAAEQQRPPRFLALSSLAAREPELSAYANSKRLGEQTLADHAGNMPWTTFRPPAVYGPGDKEMLPLFQAMAKGFAPMITPLDARFSLLYVQDLVTAMHRWLLQDRHPQGVYELHDGLEGGYDFPLVVKTVQQITGKRIRTLKLPTALLTFPALINWCAGQVLPYAPMLTPGKLRELAHTNWVCSNNDLQNVLDWEPAFTLLAGLENTPGWHNQAVKAHQN